MAVRIVHDDAADGAARRRGELGDEAADPEENAWWSEERIKRAQKPSW
jgi:hypothetical protein